MIPCRHCGASLVDGSCPRCTERQLSTFVHRELAVLVALVTIAVVTFLATRSIAGVHRDLRLADAAQWFRLGQSELDTGNAVKAVEALRRATSIDGGNVEYRLALADAFEASRRLDAARRTLLDLRQRAPERPDINARLARLEAHRTDESAAVRYYQNALYGVWPDEALEDRRRLRLEFIRYLLSRARADRALAELLAIEDSLPDDPASHVEAGDLFLQAGDARRALAHHRAALRGDPRNAAALAGAGRAAFMLQDYASALRYLRAVPDEHGDLAETRSLASLVVTRDPLAPRLSYPERRRRLEQNLRDAAARIASCPLDRPSSAALSTLQGEIEALQARLGRRTVREPLELIEDGVDLAARVAQEAQAGCGPPSLPARAIVLIAARHGLEPR